MQCETQTNLFPPSLQSSLKQTTHGKSLTARNASGSVSICVNESVCLWHQQQTPIINYLLQFWLFTIFCVCVRKNFFENIESAGARNVHEKLLNCMRINIFGDAELKHAKCVQAIELHALNSNRKALFTTHTIFIICFNAKIVLRYGLCDFIASCQTPLHFWWLGESKIFEATREKEMARTGFRLQNLFPKKEP